MRVLISGGGIAGLTLAYWLHEYGITPVVIERETGIYHDGYGRDFYGTGYDVAEHIGLLEKLRERQLPFDDVAYVDSSGKTVAHINNSLMQKIMRQRYMALMRWMLEDVLHDALPATVERIAQATIRSRKPSINPKLAFDGTNKATLTAPLMWYYRVRRGRFVVAASDISFGGCVCRRVLMSAKSEKIKF